MAGDRGNLPSVEIHGYCDTGPDDIRRLVDERGPESLLNLGGEYAITTEGPPGTYIATSHGGYQHHFCCVWGDRFFHGPTVAEVLRRSSMPWRWNWRGVGDLMQIEYLLDEETLHPDIRRIPGGTVLHFDGGRLRVLRSDSFQEKYALTPGGPRPTEETARAAFLEELDRWLSKDVILPLSGGWDSRMLLAGILACGVRPRVLTMGTERSTDVVVATQICRGLGLEQEIVRFEPRDYVEHGLRIVELAGGAEVAWHWHTYLYPRTLRLDSDSELIVGSNGEFANNGHQLDYGFLSRGLDAVTSAGGAVPLLRRFWSRKLQWPFRREELHFLRPELAVEYDRRRLAARADRLASYGNGSILERLDQLFLEQRVRNFHGVGQALIQDTCRSIAPFLGRRWIREVWHLPRTWKQGLRWARYVIERSHGPLMSFPEVNKKGIAAGSVSARPKPFYWKKREPLARWVPFADYPDLFDSDDIYDVLLGTPQLRDLCEPALVSGIVDEHRRQRNRARAISFLLSMAFWTRCLSRLQG